jgi:rod shape-determining protein MreD
MMRNAAFLAVGMALLALQENVFRAIDDVRSGLALALWLVAVALDVVHAVRPTRAVADHTRVFSTVRLDWTLPATVLLGYALLARIAGWHVGRPIPTLVLPLILFMGVHEYSLARGAAVAFAFGYVTDVLGIAPIGLYTFSYVATFVFARAAGLRFAAQTVWMQVLLVGAFALVQSTMVLVLLAIFGRDPWVPRSLYPLALPHAIATAAVAPIVFRISQAVQTATTSSPRTAAARVAPS